MVRLEPHNAQLLLQIYDMRREEKLRKARAWLIGNFWAEDMKGFAELCPLGSETNASFRQVTSYWDMVAAIVNRGMLDEDLFFETTMEALLVWLRAKSVALEMREARKNPLYLRNLELMADKQAKWLDTRAPGAVEATRKAVDSMRQKAATGKH